MAITSFNNTKQSNSSNGLQ